MSRYTSVGLLVAIAAIGVVFLLLYRTPVPEGGVRPILEEQAGKFGGVSLKIEYATTTAARELGLSGRESIALDEAMLFVFPEDDYYGFWMKDTLIPLDIFWLDAQGQVVHIAEDVPPSSYPDVFYPSVPARYVLETAAGFTRTHAITVGTPLSLKSFPSVSE